MLVKLTDIKGRDYWINPMYVKAVAAAKGGGAEVYITFGTTWSQTQVIKTEASPEEVAGWISAAMPEGSGVSAYYAAAGAAEEEVARQQQQAAQAAAMSG